MYKKLNVSDFKYHSAPDPEVEIHELPNIDEIDVGADAKSSQRQDELIKPQQEELLLADKKPEDTLARQTVFENIKNHQLIFVPSSKLNQRYRGQFPLHVAVWYGNWATFECVLNERPWVNAVNWQGYTPMALAAKCNRVPFMKRLKKRQGYVVGLDSVNKNSRVIHPVVAALENQALEAVIWLLDNGAAVSLDSYEVINVIASCKNIPFLTELLRYLNQKPTLLVHVMQSCFGSRGRLLNHFYDMARIENRKITPANAGTPEAIVAKQFCDAVIASYRVMVFISANHLASYELLYPYENGLLDNLRYKCIIPFKSLMSAQELTPQQVAEQYRIAMHFRAERNIGNARFELGMLYQEGSEWRLVKQEPQLALYWFLRGAKRGDVRCCFEVAKMLLEGQGVPKDTVQGYRRLRQAMWLSYDKARFALVHGRRNFSACFEKAQEIERYINKHPPGWWGYRVNDLEHYYYHTSKISLERIRQNQSLVVKALVDYFEDPLLGKDAEQQEKIKAQNRKRYYLLQQDRVLSPALKHQVDQGLMRYTHLKAWANQDEIGVGDAKKEAEATLANLDKFRQELYFRLKCEITSSEALTSGHVPSKEDLKRLRQTVAVMSALSSLIPFAGSVVSAAGVGIADGVELFMTVVEKGGRFAAAIPGATETYQECHAYFNPAQPLDQKHTNMASILKDNEAINRLTERVMDTFSGILSKIIEKSIPEAVAWLVKHMIDFMNFAHLVETHYSFKMADQDKTHEMIIMWIVYGNILLDKSQHKDTSPLIFLLSGERVSVAQLFKSAGVCGEWVVPGREPQTVRFDLVMRDKTDTVIFNTNGHRYNLWRLLFPLEISRIKCQPTSLSDDLCWQVGSSFLQCPGLYEQTYQQEAPDAHLETKFALAPVLTPEQQRIQKLEQLCHFLMGQVSHLRRHNGIEAAVDVPGNQKSLAEMLSLQERLESAELEIRQLKHENRGLIKKVEKLEENKQELQKTLSELKEEVTSLKEELSEMRRILQLPIQPDLPAELNVVTPEPRQRTSSSIPQIAARTPFGLYQQPRGVPRYTTSAGVEVLTPGQQDSATARHSMNGAM